MSFLALIVFALFNNVISLIYTVLAVHVLWRLAHEWRSLVDQTVTKRDTDLAWKLGFFLLTPIGVLAHESAHLLTARALGAQHTSLTWLLYWGYVTYTPSLSAVDEFAVSAAGPAVTLVLGLAALLVAIRLRSPWQDIFQAFGTPSLALVLIVYPAMNYWSGFGDFTAIYGTSLQLSILAGTAHAVGIVAFALLAGRLTRRDRISHWVELVKTYPGQRCQFGEDNAARLRALESSPTRFLPGVRQELLALRQLRDWVDEHNREIEALEAQP